MTIIHNVRARKPHPDHVGKNGFRDAQHGDKDDDVTLRDVRLAQYVLANKGEHVPSPDTLRRLGASKHPVETVERIDSRIDALKKRHAHDLATLFAFQRAEYVQELADHVRRHDVSAYMDVDQGEFKDALEALDRDVPQMTQFKHDADDALSSLQYAYLRSFLRLLRKKHALKQNRDAWFPQTPQQYYQIFERDLQLRVARFLSSSTVDQDRMADEFNWPYRTVQPLLSAYQSNPTFKHDVANALTGLIVSDPRKRPRPSLDDVSAPFTRFEPVS